MRRSLVALALAVLVLPVAACGDDDRADAADEAVSVAFLRAVGGVPSTEPAFLGALRSAGFVEGRNLTLLAADADEAYPDPDDAAEAVRGWVEEDGVDLIVALSSSGARIAADTAPDTDVLFLSTDPTATGLVEDEDAPEGRLTGVSFRVPADRTLSLLQRAVVGLDRVGLAYPPADPAAIANRDTVAEAADELGIGLSLATFTDGTDVAAAIATLVAEGVDALLVSTSPVATRALPETGAAAAAAGLPVMANTTVADFALLSLTADTEELGRQLGRQAARLLAGEDPSTVPVEDPNRFVLTLNDAVAAGLGITFDPGLVREADDVVG
jgi:putative ABC transport system substrate-binding protein